MWLFSSVVIVCATLVYSLARVDAWVRLALAHTKDERGLARDQLELQRATAQAEHDRLAAQDAQTLELRVREVDLLEKKTLGAEEMPPIPSNILRMRDQWEDEWARSEVDGVIREAWADSHDWEYVATALSKHAR